MLGVIAAGAVAPAEALAADNLPPVNTVPASLSVNEDSNLTLSGANAISVSDPDAGDAVVEVTLAATHGVLTLGGTTGLTFPVGDGTGDPTMTFQGTITDLNTALEGTVYDSDDNYDGSAELSITTNDLGNTGGPPAGTDTDLVPITINGVNDNPVNSVPATQTIDEDTTLTFSAANANLVSISDVDAAGDDLRITLNTTPSGSFATGTISVDDRAPLSFVSGDGIDDATMIFEGTLDEINAALDGMTFTPNRDMYGTGYGSGAGTIKFTTNDLGHNPSSPKSDSDELAIHINPVDDDPPTPRIVQGIGTYANVPEELSLASGNQLEVVDLDDNEDVTDQLEVFLGVTNGTMTFDSTAGLAFTAGDGTGDAAMTFSGSRSDITGAFDTGVTFTPAPGFTGTAQITMDVEDLTPGQNPGPGHAVGDIRVDTPGDTVYYAGSKVTGTTIVPSVGAVIGRAGLDGGGGANLFGGSTLADTPAGIAIDLVEEKIYWSAPHPFLAATPQIYRGNLDGTGTPELFVSGNPAPTGTFMKTTPSGLIIDQTTRRLYWTSTTTSPSDLANKSISYVSLDGPVPATSGGTVAVSTGTGAGGPRAFALDLENDRFFFGDTMGDAIGVTPTPGATGTNSRFTVSGATPSDPRGIAYDPATDRLYWGNSVGDLADERVRYADLNGTMSITGQVFDIGTAEGGGLKGLALDPAANRLYWSTAATGGGKIEHASLAGDGSDSGALDLGDANHRFLEGVTLLKDPEPVSAPIISGTPEAGQTLTCGDVTWAADLVSGSLYRMATSTAFGGWTLDGNPIAGANDATYTPSAAGEYRCSREASNFAGTSTAESAPVTISAPGAVDDAVSVAEDSGASAIDVTANDTGAPKTIVAKTNGAHGTVQITGGGSGLTYAPDANFCGTDTFTYTLTLGSMATVAVTITCADDLSHAVADSFTVTEDSGLSAIDVLANDTDIDGGMTIVSTSDPAHGSVAITAGGSGLVYGPDVDFCGRDSFSYALNGGSTANVSITVPCIFDRALTLRYKDRKQVFKGQLTSPEGDCGSAKVVVFRKRAGDDQRVGSDRTSPTGAWSVAEPDAKGRFYAITGGRTVAGGTCTAAKSPTLKVGRARSGRDGTPTRGLRAYRAVL